MREAMRSIKRVNYPTLKVTTLLIKYLIRKIIIYNNYYSGLRWAVEPTRTARLAASLGSCNWSFGLVVWLNASINRLFGSVLL